MKKIIIITLLFTLFLTGCSYRELNELAIGNALGIDYINDEFLITVQVLNLKKDGESSESENSVIYEGKGKTIPTAIRNISLAYPKILYLGHLELVVIGKSTLTKSFHEILDYFIRSPETRDDFYLLLNPSGTAQEILTINQKKTNTFPSKEIISTLENNTNIQGTSVKINMEQFISLDLEKGINPVLTGIELKEEELKLTGIIAIGKKEEIYQLDEKQSIAYNIINSNFFDIIIPISYKDTILDLVIISPKTKITMNFKDKLTINIKVNLTSQISQINKEINLEQKSIQNEIEASANKTLTSYIESLLNFCDSNQIDILGLGNIIYKKYHKYYEKYKDLNLYHEAKFNVKVDTKTFRYGNLYRSAKGE